MFSSIAQVFSANLLTKAVGAMATLAIIRFMTPGQYAEYTLAIAIVSTFSGILIGSFNRIYIVAFKRFNINVNKGAYLTTQLLLSSFIWFVVLTFLRENRQLLILALLLSMASCAFDFLRTDYQRLLNFNKFSQIFLIKHILYTLTVLSLVVLYRIKIQAWQIIAADISATLLISIPLIVKYKLFKGFLNLSTALQFLKSIFSKQHRYLFGYAIVLAFFGQMDIFMLRAVSNAYDLATYGSAFRYYTFLLLAMESVKSVYLPVIQNTSVIEKLHKIFHQHRKYVFYSLPIIFIGCFAAEWIIPWVDKGKYPQAPFVFQILSVSAFLSFALSPHSTVILKNEKFLFLFILSLIGFLINFVLNYILIPKYQGIGAALATLISYGILNGSIYLYSNKLIQLPNHSI